MSEGREFHCIGVGRWFLFLTFGIHNIHMSVYVEGRGFLEGV